MISYKEFIAEKAPYDPVAEKQQAEKSKLQSQQVGAWKVVVTNHAGSQAFLRADRMLPMHWSKILSSMIKYTDANIDRHFSYLFYSKSYKQGMVTEVIPKRKQVNIITVLPPRAQEVMGNTPTESVIIEGVVATPLFVEID